MLTLNSKNLCIYPKAIFKTHKNMKTSLVITTINKPNKNIKKLCDGSKKNDWSFIIIGDKKSPKKFPLRYGHFYNINEQKKLN